MATLKKKKKRKREEMERPDTMDYQEAMKDPAWDNERKWADAIMESNRRLGLWFLKLDELTKGEGSCFVIAVVQQLRREEIFDHLGEDHKQLARTMAHHLLRIYVKDFICRLKWNDPRVLELKEIFNVDQAAKQKQVKNQRHGRSIGKGCWLIQNGQMVTSLEPQLGISIWRFRSWTQNAKRKNHTTQ